MKSFRFPLERVLHWRTTQCEMEEAALARLTSQRDQFADALQRIDAIRAAASGGVLAAKEITSSDCHTLAGFQARMEREKDRIRSLMVALEREIAVQLRRTAEVRQKKQLLVKLREGRLKEWTVQRDAEVELAAADAWLFRYAAERYTTTNASPRSR